MKLTRPADRGVPRPRLFEHLDRLRATPALWLGAAAGSGKTTLLSGYISDRRLAHLWYRLDVRDGDPASFFAHLRNAVAAHTGGPADDLPLFTPEYLGAAELFALRFFETLYGRLKPPALIVFDDFHQLPEGAALQAFLPAALGAIPTGINVVILSRGMPPPSFANLRARGELAVMSPAELDLACDEAVAIARLDEQKPLPDELVARLHTQSAGWAAGLILLLEYARHHREPLTATLPMANESLFDYFATQVFMGVDAETQSLLLLTSPMPQVTAEEAVALTRNPRAAALLESLTRRNFFTTRVSDQTACYQYHPLFRDFLQAQAQRQSAPTELAANRAQAAALLAARDDLEHAASLLMEIGDWSSLSMLVQQHGPRLMAQGRHLELLRWVEALPPAVLASSAWSRFWKAMASMPGDKEASYAAFTEAYESFLATGELNGAVRAWSGAVECLIVADTDLNRMDGWRERLDQLLANHRIDANPMFEATLAPLVLGICIMRGSRGIEVERWIRAAQWAMSQPIDPSHRILASFALAMHFQLSNQRERERSVLEAQAVILKAHAVTPLALLTTRFCGALHTVIDGDSEGCRANIEEGCEIADRTGIHHWTFALLLEGMMNALIHGDVEEARAYDARLMSYRRFARSIDFAMHKIHLGWLALLEGHVDDALRRQRVAVEMAEQIGEPYTVAEALFGLSQCLHATGDQERARECLERVRSFGEEYPSPMLLVRRNLLLAFYEIEAGRPDAAKAYLTEAMERSRKEGFRAFHWWVPQTLSTVFAFALEHGVERDLVSRIIRRYGVPPPAADKADMDWPRPVRVRTLGPLLIEIDGKPITFTGKAQKKPLELLQALIALGGRGVREERLGELLWPDADGDAAIRNLHTTLHRLRKLLRHEEAIEVSRSAFTLNADCCSVDTWALDELASQIPDANDRRIERLSRRLIDLYAGDFLAGEAAAPWMHAPRDRLRALALECVDRLANQAERQGRLDLSIPLYMKGLMLEPAARERYTRLILCHGMRGDSDSALTIYRRLTGVFKQSFQRAADESARIAAAVQRGDMALLRLLVNGKEG